jgi:hypothetical protein
MDREACREHLRRAINLKSPPSAYLLSASARKIVGRRRKSERIVLSRQHFFARASRR